MQEAGFEPAKALSHQILSLAPLTAWVLLRTFLLVRFILGPDAIKRLVANAACQLLLQPLLDLFGKTLGLG